MHSSPVRRAHVTVAARFAAAPTAVWSRFVDFAEAHVGPGGSVEALRPGASRWVRRSSTDLGVVEERTSTDEGVVAYRARVPGGSALDDLDAVVRVSQDGAGSLVTWSTEALAEQTLAERALLRRWLGARLGRAGGTVLPPLTMDVWLGDYRPIARAGLDGTGTATWSPTTATLIAGERDAVLVDALMTADEAERLVEWIRVSGKRLRSVIVTHGQADHFFGLGHVLRAFPEATATAVPDVAEHAREQTGAAFRSRWDELFPGRLPVALSAPMPSPAGTFDLEGHQVQLFDVGCVAGRPTSVVSVRHLDAVIGGDLVYNGVHPWLLGTDRTDRVAWSRALDLVEALRPAWVIAGHRDPDATSDAAAQQVAALRSYLRGFDVALTSSSDAAELTRRMVHRWPDHGNRSTLEASAATQFASGRDTAREDYPDLLPGTPSGGPTGLG